MRTRLRIIRRRLLRPALARFLKPAVVFCVLLAWLSALQTPAVAIGIYNDFVQVSLSTPGPIPSGTSISFLGGNTFSSQFFNGNALATASTSVSPLGSATALVTGFASGPGSSFADSNANASTQAALLNLNASTVTFPLTISHSRNLSSSTIPFGGQLETVNSDASFSLTLDFNTLLFNFSSCFVNNCNSFDSGSDVFLFGLTPGSHSLQLSVIASGIVISSPPFSPTPEPTSLLLLGTTAAGLALARWRRRRDS